MNATPADTTFLTVGAREFAWWTVGEVHIPTGTFFGLLALVVLVVVLHAILTSPIPENVR